MKSIENPPNKLLDYFFTFLNFDLDKLSPDNLTTLAMAYVRFAYYENSDTSQEKYKNLTIPAFDDSDTRLNDIRKTFKKLQDYFKAHLQEIICPSKSDFSIRQKGTRTIQIIDGKFVEFFETILPSPTEFDAEMEIPFAEASLGDIIINGSLKAEMFNCCDNCGDYFYQKTKRITKFCSTKCSNAERQRRFQNSKRGGFHTTQSGELVGYTSGGISRREIDNGWERAKKEAKKKK